MIEALNLTKYYGNFCAIDKINFTVKPGEILGFLGNNGAGKSTTMKILTGYLTASSGTAKIAGYDIEKNSIEARREIGYLPESAPLYGEMSVRKFLDFIATVRGFSGIDKIKKIDEILETTFLNEVKNQSIETLSKGFKQRVGVAQAIIHDPKVLIMDEPTDGLDPNQKHLVRDLIRQMGDDKTIILSTHILEEVEAVCNRTIIISKGQKLIDDTPSALKARSKFHNSVVFSTNLEHESELSNALDNFHPAKSWEKTRINNKNTYRLIPRAGSITFNELNSLFEIKGLQISDLKVEEGRLDEVFREITI